MHFANLKDIEELLEEYSFTRVHRCYLVNLNEVEKFVRGEGGYLVMSDGSTIDVSRNKKEELLKKLLPNNNNITWVKAPFTCPMHLFTQLGYFLTHSERTALKAVLFLYR
ncbi:MAG: LytTR family DNA-binding domain-containing protein [Chitinophagaceae bacterium]